MSEVHLLLVDDHAVVRTGLRMLLESQSDLRIIGEASTGAEALEMAEREKPQIIVMDITLPDMSGIEVTRRLKQTHPEIAVVALTIHEDEQYFFEMLQAGAAGYIPKRAASDELIGAIRAAAMGEIYLYPSLAKMLVADYLSHTGGDPQRNSLEELLTPREEEIMRLVAQGLTNDEIAEQLVISRHTVARHRENLMRKLGLHNRSELVKYAIRKGIITP